MKQRQKSNVMNKKIANRCGAQNEKFNFRHFTLLLPLSFSAKKKVYFLCVLKCCYFVVVDDVVVHEHYAFRDGYMYMCVCVCMYI